MPVSGNIGDTIQFQITDAISVTGVKFGSGQANFNKISETVLDTIVPQTATYGKVAFQKENSVWQIVKKHLRPYGKKRRHASIAYRKHVQQYSVETGSDLVMIEARANCAEIPGLQELLLQMVSTDPTVRPTMKDILLSTYTFYLL